MCAHKEISFDFECASTSLEKLATPTANFSTRDAP
jgi:hypothetical protein